VSCDHTGTNAVMGGILGYVDAFLWRINGVLTFGGSTCIPTKTTTTTT